MASQTASIEPGPFAASRPAPQSARGRRTRAALVAAARAVFERDGFRDSRIVDITREAGVAVGSFYTHFADREDVFAAVLDEVEQDMLAPSVRVSGRNDPRAVIAAATRRYLDAYRRNARMNALMEEAAATDADVMLLRRRRAERFVRRNARGIRDLQARGLADPELDARLTAEALSHMVSRMAYRTFVEGRRVPFEALVASASRLWANALRLPEEA